MVVSEVEVVVLAVIAAVFTEDVVVVVVAMTILIHSFVRSFFVYVAPL